MNARAEIPAGRAPFENGHGDVVLGLWYGNLSKSVMLSLDRPGHIFLDLQAGLIARAGEVFKLPRPDSKSLPA